MQDRRERRTENCGLTEEAGIENVSGAQVHTLTVCAMAELGSAIEATVVRPALDVRVPATDWTVSVAEERFLTLSLAVTVCPSFVEPLSSSSEKAGSRSSRLWNL